MDTLLYNRTALPYYSPATSKESKVEARNQLLLCLSLLYTTILLSTFALPAGAKQVPVALLTGLVHFAVLAVMTKFAFNPFRLLAIAGALAVITMEAALFHKDYSPTSMIYVAAIYLPLALSLPLLDQGSVRTIWKHVSILGTAAALLGLVQIAGQVASHGLFIDPIRLLPQKILFQGYDTTSPVFYGGWLLRPNGMFLLEPSYFSQLVAMALVSEFVYFQRKWRIVVLMTALTSSFSGTGILMLVPAVLFIGSPRIILGFGLLGIALAIIMIALGFGQYFANRVLETQKSGSSANSRFVAPYGDIVRQWNESTEICLFGKGAGSSERSTAAADASYGCIPKVSLEYGLVGLSMFTLVWLTMFFGLALPRAMTVMLLILYFLSTSAFLQAFTVFLLWALTGGFLGRSATEETTIRGAVSSRSLRQSQAGRTSLALASKGGSQWQPNQS